MLLLCVTFQKQLVDLVPAQVTVDVHLEAQLAEGAVESLGVLVGSRPPPQTHTRDKLGHRHQHCPVTLPAVIHPSSASRWVKDKVSVCLLCVSLRDVVSLCVSLCLLCVSLCVSVSADQTLPAQL